jgi:hypothetical protein
MRRVIAGATIVVALMSVGCERGTEEGDRRAGGTTTDTRAPDSATTVHAPEGTWAGRTWTMYHALGEPKGGPGIFDYWVEVSLPAECTEGEPCGEEAIVSLEGDPMSAAAVPEKVDMRDPVCTAALTLWIAASNGSLFLERSSTRGDCPRGVATLTPGNGGVGYTLGDGWESFGLDPVDPAS